MTAAYVYASLTGSWALFRLLCTMLLMTPRATPTTRGTWYWFLGFQPPTSSFQKPLGKCCCSRAPQEYPSSISLALWAFDIRLPIEGLAWVPLEPSEPSTGSLRSVCSLPYWLDLVNRLPSSYMTRGSPSPHPPLILLITNSDLLQGLARVLSSFLALFLPKIAQPWPQYT